MQLRTALVGLLEQVGHVTPGLLALAANVKEHRAKAFLTTLVNNGVVASRGDQYGPGEKYGEFARTSVAVTGGNVAVKERRQQLLAQELRFAVARSGKTCYQIEQETHVHRQTIMNACRGAQIKAEDWLALAEALNIKAPSMIAI